VKILLLGDINYDPQPGDDIIRRGTDIHDIEDNSINMAICTNLPEVNRSEIMSFLAKLYDTLVHGGQVAFQVPSAEFAAKLVFTNQFNSPAMFMLYGSSKRPFRACYTMAALRAIIESDNVDPKNALECGLITCEEMKNIKTIANTCEIRAINLIGSPIRMATETLIIYG